MRRVTQQGAESDADGRSVRQSENQAQSENRGGAARGAGVELIREEVGSDVQREGAQGEGAERSSEGQSQAAGARSADILAQTVSREVSFRPSSNANLAHRTASTRFGLVSNSALSRSVSPLCASTTSLAISCSSAKIQRQFQEHHGNFRGGCRRSAVLMWCHPALLVEQDQQ